MYPLSINEKRINIYTKCPSNGTLSNKEMHMRDATECINSIGIALFAVIEAIFSNPKGLEMIMNYICQWINKLTKIYNKKRIKKQDTASLPSLSIQL